MHVFQALQQALGDRRLDRGAALGDRLDRIDEFFQADVFQQKPLGAGLDARQHHLVIVESGQDDGWWQLVRGRKLLQYIEP